MTVLYGSSVADTTLTTACQMATASGGVETSKNSSYSGGSGNFGEVWSKGNASTPAVASIPTTPTGNGWIYYPGAGTFAAGNWALVITYAVFANNGDNQTFRIFKRSGGVYTLIGSILFPDNTAAKTTYSPAAVSMPATTFAAGDGLYFDLWYKSSFGAVGDNATVYESTSSTAGVASDLQVTTSTWHPASYEDLSTRFFLQPPNTQNQAARMRFQAPTTLTLYGLETATGTLATACKLVPVIGGTSASLTTKVGTVQGSGELFSLGSTATFPGTTVPSTAGVHGYLWDVTTLEATTVAAGTWTVKVNLNWNSTYTTMASTITARVWKRSSGGVYTQIGSAMTLAGPGASTTTKTLFTLTGSSFPSMTFLAGDKLYLDVWLTVTSSGGATTRTIALWASSSATAGIAGQVEIGTPGYTPLPAPSQSQETRLRLSAQGVEDLAARMLLGALTIGNQATRLLLQTSGTTALKDSALRLGLSALALTDVALRLRLLSIQKSNLAFRLRILAVVLSNVAIRLVLAGATAALKNTAARVRLLARQTTDIAVRLRLLVAGTRNTALRLKLLTVILRDQAGRMRLLVLTSKDTALRLRLFVTRTLDVVSRLLLRSIKQADQAIRTRLLANTLKDQTTRTRLRVARLQDQATRLLLRAVQQGNLATRTRLLAVGVRDASLRLRLAIPPKLDQATRLRLLVIKTANDLGTRTLLLAARLRDQAARLRLSTLAKKDLSARLLLQTVGLVAKNLASRLLLRASLLSDQASRLRLQGASRILDQAGRMRLLALGLPNAALRLRLLATAPKDSATRLRLLAPRVRDQASRLRLAIPPRLDSAVRLRLLAITAASALGMRLLLLAVRLRDQTTRMRLRATGVRDQVARLLLQVVGQVARDQPTRLRLLVLRLRDQSVRLRLFVTRSLDTVSRLRMLSGSVSGTPLRLRLWVMRLTDNALRLCLLASSRRDVVARLLLALSEATRFTDQSLRLCLYDGAFTLTLTARDGALVATTRSSLSSVFARDGASRIPAR